VSEETKDLAALHAEALEYIAQLRGPLLEHFGTTDPELLADQWEARGTQLREEAERARQEAQAQLDAKAPPARPRATREAIVRLVWGRSTGYEPELYLGTGRDARKLDNVQRFVLEQGAEPGEVPRLTLHTIAPELPPELMTFAEILDTSAARLQVAKYALREAMSLARLEEAVRCAVEAMHTTNWRAFTSEGAAQMRRSLIEACVDSAKATTQHKLERAELLPGEEILAAAYEVYSAARQFHEDVGVEEEDKDARDMRLDLAEQLEAVMSLCQRLLRERVTPGAPVPPPTYQGEEMLPEAGALYDHLVRRLARASAPDRPDNMPPEQAPNGTHFAAFLEATGPAAELKLRPRDVPPVVAHAPVEAEAVRARVEETPLDLKAVAGAHLLVPPSFEEAARAEAEYRQRQGRSARAAAPAGALDTLVASAMAQEAATVQAAPVEPVLAQPAEVELPASPEEQRVADRMAAARAVQQPQSGEEAQP